MSDIADSVQRQKSVLSMVQEHVLKNSEAMPPESSTVSGYEFNNGIDFGALMDSYLSTGFQATHLAEAIQQINAMLDAREQPFKISEDGEDDSIKDDTFEYPVGRKKSACTIFLGYTSNLVTSGLRECIRYLVEHDLVDCLVTTAGGIEEDLIKCIAPSFIGSFGMDGKMLREKDWLMPILDKCEKLQEEGFSWTPSKLIDHLGAEINDPKSIYYWTHRNRIPVFCPSLTDGSLGDMLYFHSYRKNGIKLDIVEDLKHINTIAVRSQKTGVIILGGGVVKHHINNANLMRNGSDYTVYVNTGQEFDGSDSGAQPDEAVSWGKVKSTTKGIKVHADATLVFPLIVARTFALRVIQATPNVVPKSTEAAADVLETQC